MAEAQYILLRYAGSDADLRTAWDPIAAALERLDGRLTQVRFAAGTDADVLQFVQIAARAVLARRDGRL
jgi:hypothetical protein